MKDNELRFKLTDNLNPIDTETQTFGCRHTNPNICNSCYMDNVCAFVRDDRICKKPSAAWKKFFKKLKESK